jgi:hypothetical protein
VNGNQAIFLNAGRKPEDCKMVARALFSFQVRAAGFFAPKSKSSKWRPDGALREYTVLSETLFEYRAMSLFFLQFCLSF